MRRLKNNEIFDQQKERKIDFAPPVIKPEDIREVIKVLKSGWITTGKKVKEFEDALTTFTQAKKVHCVSSATGGLEIILRAMGIGPGDEVITSPYTFTATASVIHHVGAKIVFADVAHDSYNISPSAIEKKITPLTKAVIAVDIAGFLCDYNGIWEVLNRNKGKFEPKNGLQRYFKKPILISDASHSFGAKYYDIPSGAIADFSVFSFHAVKNLTTAEGGAIAMGKHLKESVSHDCKDLFRLYSLHGQDKDAFKKRETGWRYDIIVPGYKFNMTDIQAALGLSQLKRYSSIFEKRKKIHERYLKNLNSLDVLTLLDFNININTPAYHLFPVRVKNFNEKQRDCLLDYMKKQNIALNVHFVPLPIFTAYRKMGFRIKDYPNSYHMYKNTITLPVHLKLSLKDVDYICSNLKHYLRSLPEKSYKKQK